MPYKIKHKSYNECLIKYVEDKPAREKSGVSLTMIVGGIIAILIGIDFIFVIGVIVIMAFWRNLTNPPRRSFSIELNRYKNHITVKNTAQANARSTVLPLDHLLGFGSHETQRPKKSKKQPYARLFFKFDEGILDSPLAKKSEVLEVAKRVSDGRGGYFWPIPVRDIAHPAPVKNVQDIISATDDWLRQADGRSSGEPDIKIDEPETEFAPEPEPEPEIIRDFRELE
jgi:hypothetical protein